MRKTTTLLTAALTALFAAATAQAQETIKIGVNEPLTGAVAASGTYVTDGARIGAEVVNAHGGVLGKKIELVIEDNKSNPKEAVDAAEKLDLHAGGDAQARRIWRAADRRDVLLGQDHRRGQSVGVPHQPDVGDGGGRLPRKAQRLQPADQESGLPVGQ
jgi:hypothetical protein